MHEVELAYRRYCQEVEDIERTHEWGRYADLFTPDAAFRRVGQADCRGRESIRAMVQLQSVTAPGSLVSRREVLWHAFDLPRGRVVHEQRHTMCDPGDGSRHVALATSMLTYGGDGLWSSVDVVHAPEAYRTMYRSWARAAQRSGRQAGEELEELLTYLDAVERPLAPPPASAW